MFAGAVLVTGYVVIERSHRVPGVRSVLRAVAVLGTKGLPGYTTMVVALLVVDEFLPTLPRNDLMLIAVVAIVRLANSPRFDLANDGNAKRSERPLHWTLCPPSDVDGPQ